MQKKNEKKKFFCNAYSCCYLSSKMTVQWTIIRLHVIHTRCVSVGSFLFIKKTYTVCNTQCVLHT